MSWWDAFLPWTWVPTVVNKFIADPIRQMAGNIASGLETGFVALLGDIWRVILPGVQIIGGLIIIYLALSVGLKGQLPSVAGAAMLAAKI